MNENPSSAEDALELFLARRRRGEDIDPGTFAAQCPDFGPEFLSAVKGLAALLVLDQATRGPDTRDLAIPDRVGSFRVVREIGRGGMGVVLEAVEEPLGRRIALKMLPPELLASHPARARFRREAELAARLDHSGIATIYGAGVTDERPWIAMRFVEGETLSRAVARSRADGARCVTRRATRVSASGREEALAVAACLAKVARALHSAHEQGVVHRDIKPSNIIVAPDGAPVLLDFGLAIADEPDGGTVTRTGDTPGTPAYLAPEHLSGERARHDAQSDVYALGVTLYECLTLRRPFDAPTPLALYSSIASQSPPNPRALNRDVPPDLAVIVATAMERDRGRRYRSAAALADDLEACAAGRPIAARPLPLYGRVARWMRREPRQAALAGLLAAATIALALFGGSWWTSRDKVLAAERATRAESYEAALGEAFSSLRSNRPVQADAAFARALEFEPGSGEVLAGRVLVSVQRKDDVEARTRLGALPPNARERDALRALVAHEAPSDDPSSSWFREASAFELCIRGLCLQMHAQRLPNSQQRRLNQRALAYFLEAIARAPVAREVYHEERASAAQQVGDELAARSSAAALSKLWPDSPSAMYAAGRALYAFDHDAARGFLERAIALDPRLLDAYLVLALVATDAGDTEAAEVYARRGLRIAPHYSRLQFALANALSLRECTEDARAEFGRTIALEPTLQAAWTELALTDLMAGDDPAAIEEYEHALVLDPGSDKVRIFYAAALDRHGDRDAARVQIDQAIAGIYPADPLYWTQLAQTFSFLGAFEAALSAAEAGLASSPRNEGLADLRASALRQLGR